MGGRHGSRPVTRFRMRRASSSRWYSSMPWKSFSFRCTATCLLSSWCLFPFWANVWAAEWKETAGQGVGRVDRAPEERSHGFRTEQCQRGAHDLSESHLNDQENGSSRNGKQKPTEGDGKGGRNGASWPGAEQDRQPCPLRASSGAAGGQRCAHRPPGRDSEGAQPAWEAAPE